MSIYIYIVISIVAIHVGALVGIQLQPTDPALFKVQIRGYWSLSAEAGAANLERQPNWLIDQDLSFILTTLFLHKSSHP